MRQVYRIPAGKKEQKGTSDNRGADDQWALALKEGERPTVLHAEAGLRSGVLHIDLMRAKVFNRH